MNPFFQALGWDVENRRGLSGDVREVKLEEAIRIEESVRNPDFTFRLEGKRKFFVETKKPSVNIEGGVYPAFQVRRYAWSAGLYLSILTDFEEFAVYDCRAEPFKTDKPVKGRLLYMQYDQYVERWDEIAALFSREAVLAGSLDRFIESVPEKRGTKRVDAALLEEISKWREMLAKNIALRNPGLSQRDLNFAVQRTIDRILFLRICEDRAIEEYGRLKALLESDGIYARLLVQFREADERYNSGIFRFHEENGQGERELPDHITPAIAVDDSVLKQIIQELYFPDSPYVFSEIPAEILGQVYEQFLGKVIVLDESHVAAVEYKPEVRKAGGVYYTPSYIVEYIVKNTVGKLLEGKTPAQASELRILDPACGSGSFLIGAYQYLLDWHKDWYLQNLVPLLEKGKSATSPEVQRLLPAAAERREDKRAKKIHARAAEAAIPVFRVNGNEWRLTTAERKRILINNIYGVDIDPQAVEVTKLSLLLKVLEGETKESIISLLRYFRERALPDLGSNIKCGNSLIGWDILKELPDLTRDDLICINPFDWEVEFLEVFNSGGFDALIGNPPYVSVELTSKDLTEFYLNGYEAAYGRVNTFALFIEKSIKLVKVNGYCGLITSNRILTNMQLASLRKMMLQSSEIDCILVFKQKVFKKAAVDTTIIILRKNIPSSEHKIKIWFDIIDFDRSEFQKNVINQYVFLKNDSYIINAKQQETLGGLSKKIKEKSADLEILCDVRDGIILGAIKDLFLSNVAFDSRYKKWLEGNEVSRYFMNWSGRYICYDNSLIEEELKRKLAKAKKKASTKSDFDKISRSGIWLRNPKIFEQEKILTRQNAKRLIGVLDTNEFFVKNSLHCILLNNKNYNLRYILGILNSELMDSYFGSSLFSVGSWLSLYSNSC